MPDTRPSWAYEWEGGRIEIRPIGEQLTCTWEEWQDEENRRHSRVLDAIMAKMQKKKRTPRKKGKSKP